MANENKIKIIQGEDAEALNLYCVYENTKRPFSLVGATAIEVKIPTSGVAISKTLFATQVVIIDAKLGHITISLTDTETLTLKKGTKQNLHAIVDFGTVKRKVNFIGVLDVVEPSVA